MQNCTECKHRNKIFIEDRGENDIPCTDNPVSSEHLIIDGCYVRLEYMYDYEDMKLEILLYKNRLFLY